MICSATPAIFTYQELFGDLVFGSINTNPSQFSLKVSIHWATTSTMSDVFAHMTMCERNRRHPLLYVFLFVTACLGLLLEAQEAVTNASQDREFQAPQIDCSGAQISRIVLSGSDKLKTIYIYRAVTIAMALDPVHQSCWWQVFTKCSYFILSFKSETFLRVLVLTRPISVV